MEQASNMPRTRYQGRHQGASSADDGAGTKTSTGRANENPKKSTRPKRERSASTEKADRGASSRPPKQKRNDFEAGGKATKAAEVAAIPVVDAEPDDGPNDVKPNPQAERHGEVKTFPLSAAAIDPTKHYTVESELWWNYKNRFASTTDVIKGMAESEQWFRLYGPRQSGKTTSLFQAMKALQEDESYVCIYLSLEDMKVDEAEKPANRPKRKDFDLDLLERFAGCVRDAPHLPDDFETMAVFNEVWEGSYANSVCTFQERLAKSVQAAGKKLVILVDEVDTLTTEKNNEWLTYFLNTLRSLHMKHGMGKDAPKSIGLCALYDIQRETSNASPFNNANHWIKPITWQRKHMEKLLQPYADDSGRTITGKAIEAILFETGGHPWFTNQIMDRVSQMNVETVDVEHIEDAVEAMFREYEHAHVTGIASLESRLKSDKSFQRSVYRMSAGMRCRHYEVQTAVDLGVALPVGHDGLYEFASNIVRVICYRFLADLAQDEEEEVSINLSDIRSKYIFNDHVHWGILMEQLCARHMWRQIAVALRNINRGTDGLDVHRRMYDLLKSSVKEPLFTDCATSGLLFLLNGDHQGSVHTEQQAEDGTKPDHILRRLLRNMKRACAVVENKLAKPPAHGRAVTNAEIRSKMDEAIEDLQGYYPTYENEASAMVAVVYAPSTAKPKGTEHQSGVSWTIVNDDPRLKNTPLYKIVVRIDLGGK